MNRTPAFAFHVDDAGDLACLCLDPDLYADDGLDDGGLDEWMDSFREDLESVGLELDFHCREDLWTRVWADGNGSLPGLEDPGPVWFCDDHGWDGLRELQRTGAAVLRRSPQDLAAYADDGYDFALRALELSGAVA